MTDQNQTAIADARRRVQDAEEKFERQQRRYAMLALESDDATAAARAAMAECEAEREAARAALQKLEAESPGS